MRAKASLAQMSLKIITAQAFRSMITDFFVPDLHGIAVSTGLRQTFDGRLVSHKDLFLHATL